ncbi:MAG: phosphopantothenoylcysteine decarboxylase [Firmicutes bacterium]|nr:phosphopantothenoylcysteine decarboxylase [Bacillota bacterium]
MLEKNDLTVGTTDGITVYMDQIADWKKLDSPLEGKKVIVSAGPTHEYLDPVHFLGTPSSGKMGFCLAQAALAAGAKVVLVSGPVSLPDPEGITIIRVTSAEEMQQAILGEYEDADVVIMAAAVTDFRPVSLSHLKIKKAEQISDLRLELTPDILAGLGKNKGQRFLCGFAAETNDLETYAKNKLIEKNLDLILANNILQEGAGFAVDTNAVTAYYGDEKELFPLMSKADTARRIIALIGRLMHK